MWPESRESLPKQFIPVIGQRSTFQSIVSVSDPAVFGPTVVITNFEYRFRVAEQLREIAAEAVILLEPDRRDSASALGAAAARAAARDSKIVVGVLAADHVFADGKQFARRCAEAYAVASGEIVTFGVTPDHPATGYGYIHPGAQLPLDPQVRRIERFVEKPDETHARAFIEDGYLWDSGNFVFRADVMPQELQRFEPEIAAATVAAVSAAKKDLGFVVFSRGNHSAN
jgi:mannose-1-phosphate guanylyltransferase / mannose-6-phosphate isomerase